MDTSVYGDNSPNSSQCYGLRWERTTTNRMNTGESRQPALHCHFNSQEPLRMLNVVFGKTSGNDVPLDHGLQAQKYLMAHNEVYRFFQAHLLGHWVLATQINYRGAAVEVLK